MQSNVLFALSLTVLAGLATGVGSVIALFAKTTNTKFLAGSLGFSAGVMIYVSMIEIFQKSRTYLSAAMGDKMGYYLAVASFFAGILFIGMIDYFVPSAEGDIGNLSENDNRSIALKRMGFMTALAIGIHNFPEGLAIGSGFEASISLGFSLAIAIALHDIPEGISMAVPMKNGGIGAGKVLFYVILSGVTTGIGAFFGAIVGGISQNVIAMCLAFAAGAMLYIVSGELLPESNSLYRGKLPALGNIVGFVLGILSMV